LEVLFENDARYAASIKKAIRAPEERGCRADRVSFQYFNGERFILLPESRRHERLFKDNERCEFLFTVPGDMEICEIGGVRSYWVRVCLEDAENLYYRPCKMLCPQINDIQISYGASVEPRQIKKVTAAGTQTISNGGVIYENRYGEAPYFYMGFDGTIGGKLTLLINTDQNYGIPAISGEWEVSVKDGFAPVTTVDETEMLSYSGRIVFNIPKAAAKCETVFHQEGLYWLRVPLIRGLERYPEIKMVYVNAAEFYLSGECSKGEMFVLKSSGYQDIKAVTVTDSHKSESAENEEERIRHMFSNTTLMINETDISKTLLLKIPELEEIKCVFDNSQNQLSVYPKFKGTHQEECFNRYAFFIKKLLTEACGYKIRLVRPVKAWISVRAVIDKTPREAAVLREKIIAFLDYQSGGYNSRGWKTGELPDKNAIQGFFEVNGVKAGSLIVSAGVYAGASDGYYREYMIEELKEGVYASAAGEISLICKERDGTDNS
jgi:hypothetical protein